MPYHIVIIGAGASGLMAGCELIKKGHTVSIIEARDRVGGRIHTLHSKFSIPVELGAEFIHGDQPLTMSIAKKSKSALSILTGNQYQIRNSNLYEGDFFDNQWELFTKALENLKTDTDMASFLNQYFKGDEYNELRKSVRAFVEGYDAADLDRVSAMALKEEWAGTDDDRQHHIAGGYSSLINYLKKTFEDEGGAIIYSSPVSEIQWFTGKVKVITDMGNSFEGDKVIVTVPLGVLQKDSIHFTPSLPDHKKAFDAMGFGGVIKFLFEFKQPFWESLPGKHLKDISFIFSDAPVPTWWSQRPNTAPLLTGWLGGPSTFTMSNDKAVLFEKAITSIQYIFKCSIQDIRDQIKTWHITDWVHDPFTYGTYAYTTVNTSKSRLMISKPIHSTIYFAGEALYEGRAMGTVEAALINGKEVANKINNN